MKKVRTKRKHRGFAMDCMQTAGLWSPLVFSFCLFVFKHETEKALT